MKPRHSVVAILILLLALPAAAQFTQQGPKLVATGAVGNAQQGFAVALSGDGNTAIVAANNDVVNSPAAWVWTRSGSVWTQQSQKLIGLGLGTAQQGVSAALSSDGNTALVGGSSDNGSIGAAWVWTRNQGAWTQQFKLIASNYIGFPRLGLSVSLSADGNTAIVGGPFDSNSSGAAWIWTRSGAQWIQQTKLVGTAGAAQAEQGFAVALSADGNTAITGAPNVAPGAVWIWRKVDGVWTQSAKLVGTGGVGLVWQGYSVALNADGTTAIVGAPADNSFMGAAWIFTRSGETWTQQSAKLVAPAATEPVQQGHSVAISADGNTAIVGGFGDKGTAGAAWIWKRDGNTWSVQSPKLVGSNAIGSAHQGFSVSLSADGNTAMSGGYLDFGGMGAAWVFTAIPQRHRASKP